MKRIAKKLIGLVLGLALVMGMAVPTAATSASERTEPTVGLSISSGFAVKQDGNLWAWGRVTFTGSIRVGTLFHALARGLDEPRIILEDVSAVSVGFSHIMALKNDGTLWGLGNNRAGQLGTGTTNQANEFTHIMDDVISVSTG